MYEDKTLTCRDCGREFIFTAGEQEFFAERGLENEPHRCPDCRRERKLDRRQKEIFEVVCAMCGAVTTVPFEPKPDRAVYCGECYAKRRARQQDIS